jgi:L-alanine-DL-glutamate epimerase-like enolase superfamily enzyme
VPDRKLNAGIAVEHGRGCLDGGDTNGGEAGHPVTVSPRPVGIKPGYARRVSIYDRLADLDLTVDGYGTERGQMEVSTNFTRVTTTVVMHGGGHHGRGEDVAYVAADHLDFPETLPLAGARSLRELSARLDAETLYPHDPAQEAARDYRRWAFESAALDLALRQAGLSLAQAVGRTARSVRFVVSTRGDVDGWMAVDPALEFKLDPTAEWDEATIARLAATGRVRVLDLKAFYEGTGVDLLPDPVLYRAIATGFPDAVIEDPRLEGECREALRVADDRLSFDAPIHSLADVDALPVSPRWLNIKPSRFGTVQRLLECIEACEERGIRMYGGGQFELGVGRHQIQVLASVFYPDTPNDVAPGVYNEGDPRPGLPRSPLPALDAVGF